MEVVSAVLRDLYIFAVKYGFGFFSDTEDQQKLFITAPEEKKVFKAAEALLPKSKSIPTPIPTPAPTEQTVVNAVKNDQKLVGAHVGYSNAISAAVYALPTRSFDGVIMRLEYGQSFQVLNSQGQWLQIIVGDTKGWLHGDYFEESMSLLQPNFIVGHAYTHADKQTVALRTNIKDEFSARELHLPLQDIEYASYKLQQKNRFITWPSERPRIAGTWQRLLRGVRGVHLGVQPKTQSVFEYILEDNTGHVAFVESVYPDGSVTLSEVGYLEEGMYSERTLSKEEWKELRPIFIEVA